MAAAAAAAAHTTEQVQRLAEESFGHVLSYEVAQEGTHIFAKYSGRVVGKVGDTAIARHGSTDVPGVIQTVAPELVKFPAPRFVYRNIVSHGVDGRARQAAPGSRPPSPEPAQDAARLGVRVQEPPAVTHDELLQQLVANNNKLTEVLLDQRKKQEKKKLFAYHNVDTWGDYLPDDTETLLMHVAIGFGVNYSSPQAQRNAFENLRNAMRIVTAQELTIDSEDTKRMLRGLVQELKNSSGYGQRGRSYGRGRGGGGGQRSGSHGSNASRNSAGSRGRGNGGRKNRKRGGM